MSFLNSLFSGVKVFVREIASAAADAVRIVLEEIDRSAFGKAATGLVRGVTNRYFSDAKDLAEEERELAQKYRRDGRRTEADEERLDEIQRQRANLKEQMDIARTRDAQEELRDSVETVISSTLDDDQVSGSVGILSSKVCPSCGELMRIRQGGFDSGTARMSFYWSCTSVRNSCPTLKFDPRSDNLSVLRKKDPNFDLSQKERRNIWQRKDILLDTAIRVRQGLDEEDKNIVCPTHLIPMKLSEKPNADGRLLATYEYVCLGVDADGRACRHKISLETFPQVSEALRRRDGVGIIRE